MTIVNFGYEKKIITPDELLSLKEEPFVILDTTILVTKKNAFITAQRT